MSNAEQSQLRCIFHVGKETIYGSFPVRYPPSEGQFVNLEDKLYRVSAVYCRYSAVDEGNTYDVILAAMDWLLLQFDDSVMSGTLQSQNNELRLKNRLLETMLIRQKCGCLQRDCKQHGAWTAEMVTEMEAITEAEAKGGLRE